jgi:copper chaperone CopZ
MSCEHCIGTVKAALDAVPGVSESCVQINAAEVRFDEQQCRPSQVISAVRSSGAFDVLGFRIENPS